MNTKPVLRVVLTVALGLFGALVLSQSGSGPELPTPGLSTQAAGVCAGLECETVQVDQIIVHSDGNVYFNTSGNEAALSCAPLGGAYLQIAQTQNNFKEMYTGILAQQLSNKTVSVRVDNTPGALCNVLWITLGRS